MNANGYWIVRIHDSNIPIYNNETKSYERKHLISVGNICRCSVCKDNFIGDLISYNSDFSLPIDRLPQYCGKCGTKMDGYKNIDEIVTSEEEDDDDYTEYE